MLLFRQSVTPLLIAFKCTLLPPEISEPFSSRPKTGWNYCIKIIKRQEIKIAAESKITVDCHMDHIVLQQHINNFS